MTYLELKQKIANNPELSKKIYITNFFTCKSEKMCSARITMVKNIFGYYIVTYWLDYEYNKYLGEKTFSNKDEAANYAWNMFVECDNIYGVDKLEKTIKN